MPTIEEKIQTEAKAFEERVTALKNEAERDMKAIQESTPDPNSAEFILNIDFDVKWKRKVIKFDIPEVRMETDEMKFDIPEVRMETDEFCFDIPSGRWEMKVIGKKPEFYCKGLKCKVKWTDIKTKIWVPYMKRKCVKFDVPKFNSKTVSIKMDVPKFNSKTIEIKLDWPHFYLKEVKAEFKEAEDAANAVSSELQAKIAREQAEFELEIKSLMGESIASQFEASRAELESKKDELEVTHVNAIAEFDASITMLRAQGATAKVAEVESQKADFATKTNSALAAIETALRRLDEEETKALMSIGATP